MNRCWSGNRDGRIRSTCRFRVGGEPRWTVAPITQIPVTPFAFPDNDGGKNPEDSARRLFAPRAHQAVTSTSWDTQWIDNQRLNAQRALAVATTLATVKPNFSRADSARGRGTEAIDRDGRTVEAPVLVAKRKGAGTSTTTYARRPQHDSR